MQDACVRTHTQLYMHIVAAISLLLLLAHDYAAMSRKVLLCWATTSLSTLDHYVSPSVVTIYSMCLLVQLSSNSLVVI
jgi:hypothetical protein